MQFHGVDERLVAGRPYELLPRSVFHLTLCQLAGKFFLCEFPLRIVWFDFGNARRYGR